LRDALLEARFVSSSGSIVKAGGPTVKNVTGFDLCRVLVGSLGTLGLLAEVVLRTRPLAPASCWLRGAAEPEAAMEVLWRPAAVLADGASTWVLLEGHAVDVAAERDALARLGFEEVDGPPELPPHRWSVPPAEWRQHVSPGRVIAEVGVGTLHADHPQPGRALDSRVIELHRRLKARFDPACRLNPGRDVLWGVVLQ
jgi:glycolate oxidase FAD binding subunit